MNVSSLLASSAATRTNSATSSVYYDPRYLAAVALLEPDTQWHLWRHRSAMIPLIIRPLPNHLGHGFDVISPYDFSGPQVGEEDVSEVYAALRDWANRNDVVTGFFRFHPLIGDPALWNNLEGFELIHAADNVVIELGDEDAWLQQFKPRVMRDAKVAKRAGVTCRIHEATCDLLDDFVPHYWSSIERLGGDTYYRFPRSFFDPLSGSLGEKVQIAQARVDDKTVASALLLLDERCAFYYLAWSNDTGRRVCAMNFLMIEIAYHLQRLGVSRFHLGGGSESLRKFKARFSRHRVPYYIGKAIFDKDRYAAMSQQGDTKFFPAYRAPD